MKRTLSSTINYPLPRKLPDLIAATLQKVFQIKPGHDYILDCATHTLAEVWMSAIHPFSKYAPKNDRLSEQIYNKFN